MTTTSTPSKVPLASWWILALLMSAGFLNYFDRQILSVLKSTLQTEIGFDEIGYSQLVTGFLVPYVVMYVVGGRLVDLWGYRVAMTAFIAVWSVACVLCGMADSFALLLLGRVLLGLAEPGVFPAMQVAIVTWFPREHRASVLSMNAMGPMLGAVMAAPLVAFVALKYGWHEAFWMPGVAGLVLAVVWWFSTERPPCYVSPEEAAMPPAPYGILLKDRRLLGLVAARVVSDPVWYFYLFWLPGFFQRELGLTLSQLGWVGWIPNAAAAVALLFAGWLTDRSSMGPRPARRSRLQIFGVGAALAAVGATTTFAADIWLALLLVSVVSIGCQLWFYGTGLIIIDMFPRNSVASVSGVIGALGALAGMVANAVAGPIIQEFGYRWVFIGLGCLHLVGFYCLARWAITRSDYS